MGSHFRHFRFQELQLVGRMEIIHWFGFFCHYRKCEIGSQSNLLFDSYDVERTYTKNHSLLEIIGWSSLVLFGGLIVVKFIAKAIIYIFGGGNKAE